MGGKKRCALGVEEIGEVEAGYRDLGFPHLWPGCIHARNVPLQQACLEM